MTVRWARYVACLGRREIHIGFWWESQKERVHWEGLDVGGTIILESILEKQDRVVWDGFI
jgi:hypothetical protein